MSSQQDALPIGPVGAGPVPDFARFTHLRGDPPVAMVRLGALPLSRQVPVDSFSHRRHNLVARLLPPQTWDAPNSRQFALPWDSKLYSRNRFSMLA